MKIDKALITGVNGFVGEYLTQYLEQQGYWVCGISNQSQSDLKIPYQRVDVSDAQKLVEILELWKPDCIYHLAGISSVKFSFTNPVLTHQVNVLGTRNLLEAVRQVVPHCRVVIVSSAECYAPKEAPLNESDPLDGSTSPYAASRIEQEAVCREYPDLHWVISRSFNHIGPRQTTVFVVADFARQAAEIFLGRHPPVIEVGNIDVVRDFTDVRDMVRAYELLALQGVSQDVYNIGSGQGVLVRKLLQILLEFTGKQVEIRLCQERYRPADKGTLICDNRKFQELAHWQAQYPLQQTLADTFAYWVSVLDESQKI